MHLSELLKTKRVEVLHAVRQFGALNPRTFSQDRCSNDEVEILVDVVSKPDLIGLQIALEALLGLHVELLTPAELPPRMRTRILRQAQPI